MDAIAQTVAITNEFAVDENHHMLSNLVPLVEHVTAGSFVFAEVLVQDARAVDPETSRVGQRDMALNILRESYCGHKLHNSTGKGFPTAIVPVTLAEFLPISMKNVFFGLQYRR